MFLDPISDDQIVAVALSILTPFLAWLVTAARGWLGARSVEIMARVLEGAVDRAVALALDAHPEAASGARSLMARSRAVDCAHGYITATRPDLVRKIGATDDQLRLRIQAEIARQQMWARERAASPRPG